jgi:hypothetical protein
MCPDFAGLETEPKFSSLTGKLLLSSERTEDRRSWITMRLFPAIEFFFGLLLGVAIPFLQLANELVLFAFDDLQVVIVEFSPLFLHLAFELFPVSGYLIPIHTLLLLMRHLLVGSSPCPSWVQIDHEQIPLVVGKK